MAGFAYVAKDLSTRMMNSQKFFDCPDQYKKLRIRTGTEPSATIGYGLTTDTTASGSSPAILYTNNKVCYLGTYSTGSSSSSGTGTYIADSGYKTITTKTVYLTEQVITDEVIDVPVIYEEDYIDHYIDESAYYSLRAIYEYGSTFYKSDQGGQYGSDTLYIEFPPNYREEYDRFTLPNPTSSEKETRLGQSTNKYYDTGGSPTTWAYGNMSVMSELTKTTETFYHDPDVQNFNIASRLYTAKSWMEVKRNSLTSLAGYVASKHQPVWSKTQKTSYSQETHYGPHIVTTSTSYETDRYYTETTSVTNTITTNYWTHSNINVT